MQETYIRWACKMITKQGEQVGVYYWAPSKRLEECKTSMQYLKNNNKTCTFELTDYDTGAIIHIL